MIPFPSIPKVFFSKSCEMMLVSVAMRLKCCCCFNSQNHSQKDERYILLIFPSKFLLILSTSYSRHRQRHYQEEKYCCREREKEVTLMLPAFVVFVVMIWKTLWVLHRNIHTYNITRDKEKNSRYTWKCDAWDDNGKGGYGGYVKLSAVFSVHFSISKKFLIFVRENLPTNLNS